MSARYFVTEAERRQGAVIEVPRVAEMALSAYAVTVPSSARSILMLLRTNNAVFLLSRAWLTPLGARWPALALVREWAWMTVVYRSIGHVTGTAKQLFTSVSVVDLLL